MNTRNKWRLLPVGLLVASAIGCGTGKSFTHQDDPLLGNFNRPITPTPPPTGSDIGNVWQGGPGIYPAPAIGNNTVPLIPGQMPPLPGTVAPNGGATSTYVLPGPTTSNATMAGGKSLKDSVRNFFNPSNADAPAKVPQQVGAGIPLDNRFAQPQQPQEKAPPAWSQQQDPNAVTIRQPGNMVGSGSSIVPDQNLPPMQIPMDKPMPVTIGSIEDGQQILATYGVKWQRLERVENGDWQYTCAVANPNTTNVRQYSARHPEQLQAVKSVVEQVQRDK